MKSTIFLLLVYFTHAYATIKHNQSQQNTRLRDTISQEPITSTTSNTSTLVNTNIQLETEEFLDEDNFELTSSNNKPARNPQISNLRHEAPKKSDNMRSINCQRNVMSNSKNIQKIRSYERWCVEEEAQLLQLFNKFKNERNKWGEISNIMGRSQNALRVYYSKNIHEASGNETLKRKKWSVEENAQIIKMMEIGGNVPLWLGISEALGTRADLARKHYRAKLDPNRIEENRINWNIEDESWLWNCAEWTREAQTDLKL